MLPDWYLTTGQMGPTWTPYLSVSRTSSLEALRSCRYCSVSWLKCSETDPKVTSGLRTLRLGSGQRDTFFRYLDLLL